MNLLAVETSGFEGSLALMRDGSVVDERRLGAKGQRNAQTLVAEASTLLTDQSLSPADIDVVAVSIGPGSFTGLRVGVTFAKTFGWANEAVLIAVDTFRAIADQVEPSEPTVTVISDAQRNELFVNEYVSSGDNWREQAGHVRLETVAQLLERSSEQTGVIVGPGLHKHRAQIEESHRIAASETWDPTASAIARIGWQQFKNDDLADGYTLEPLYIRRSYAEEKLAN